MNIKTYPIIRSLASYVLPNKIMNRPGSGGTFSSAYCYSVWLRHLVNLFESNLISDLSEVKKVAEIGPGDSLGIGLAALFSGADHYYGFDVIEHSNNEKNFKILNDLSHFFADRKDIPHKGLSYRNTKPLLENYDFPRNILGGLSKNLVDQRRQEIELSLNQKSNTVKIKYIVPWDEQEIDLKGDIDLIFSQAVMEHVIDVNHAYETMNGWLKPGGVISHQIDYKAHEISDKWNGHWYIGSSIWNFLMKGRKYPINRLPHSSHLRAIQNAGFEIRNVVPFFEKNHIENKKPKVNRPEFTEDDMKISSALIQAVKI
jgi:SAM-dependent methyltransferase